MLRKEFIQALRDPRMRVLLFLPPVIQLLVFGFAVNMDVDHSRIAWMDMDRTPLSRDLRQRFEGSGRFDVVATPQSEEDVQRVLDRGEAQAVIRVRPNFERDVMRGRTTEVQILIDGTNSNTASIVGNYAGQVIADFSAAVTTGQQNVRILTRSPVSAVNVTFPSVAARTRVWFNPDLHSRNYFVPGVVANIIMMVTLMLTALAIVREKEIGTMEQLMVTPIRPLELMLGKTLPFAVVGLLDVVLITGVALLVFHVPMKGNPLLLLLCAVLFLMTSLGAGLFLSTVSHTQQQAMMANFFFSTPAFMLSGFAFPIRNMPVAVQYLTYLNPLRYFMEIVRGIFLKGVGISVLWPQMAALLIYGVAVLSLSAARFHKTLE
ncbi:MAG TPA: ABC transporter permease [Candidatus Sulfopaludibacter sp.]|jgi:ABC-2 type transport system permease protein|nr:ABC transporter permease [Candidatus Sulfopaludibacter sp.]